MGRWIPVEVLEHAGYPAFISDESGRIEYCNEMAAKLVRAERSALVGRPCWELMRLRSPEGKRLCRPDCHVQSDARRGKLEKVTKARFAQNGDEPTAVDLLTVAVSPQRNRRCAILHVIKLGPAAEVAADAFEACCSEPPTPIDQLTARERQVLGHLSKGLSTDAIAGTLFVSRATVRNHVRAILSKMGVHSRVQAVVASVSLRTTALLLLTLRGAAGDPF